jgi:Uma2 family endonuclease
MSGKEVHTGSTAMPVSERTFQTVALEDPEGQWELHCGTLRRKPAMSYEHNYIALSLQMYLIQQLDQKAFRVSHNGARLRISAEHYYIPDLCVIPIELLRPHRGSYELEVYEARLPLVVEVWSPSTGDYDVDVKVLEYQRRGDLEIWRIHPYERTLTAWRRQPDGSYPETLHTHGTIRPGALPSVTIDLDRLFD